ncbi:MAG: helix-turn-helix domain-containing protein [Syntrophaceticus sp.]
MQPSLKAMVEDVGIDFDTFLDQLEDGKTDEEIAAKTGVSSKVIRHFREHFEKYGIDSVIGQD